MPNFRVVEINVPDREIWPTDYTQRVKRYALVDGDNHDVVWVNGHVFGFLDNMTKADRTSRDCRYLLRETKEEALKDSEQWYHFEYDQTNKRYITVITK